LSLAGNAFAARTRRSHDAARFNSAKPSVSISACACVFASAVRIIAIGVLQSRLLRDSQFEGTSSQARM
jgi:hypothetical protein